MEQSVDIGTSAEIVVTRLDGVAILQLNRPNELNSLTPTMMTAIAERLELLDVDNEIRAIVIAGDDRAFAAGSDLKMMRDRPFHVVLAQAANRFWKRIAEIETPLIAGVSGYAFGAGCELALSCDMIVAAESALFSQAEITVGIVPGGGGTQRLTRAIGKHRAMDMVLTGRRVSAPEALAFGFVNQVVPEHEWRTAAVERAKQVASMPPIAVMLAKRAVLAADETSLAVGMNLERRLYELAMATEDRVEGMTAFLDRRAPVWKGR